MKLRLTSILIIILFCTACLSGKIPCPEPKVAKLRKNYSPRRSTEYTASLHGQTKTESDIHDQSRIPRDNGRTISNVTIEEWDCPKPGTRRYLPREVKQNIKRNTKKIKQAEARSDSTQRSPGYRP
jgi:hypothetical protein